MKKFKDVNLSNDFLFGKTMENESICKKFLERLLHIKIRKIIYIEGQKVEQDYYDCKGVRFDVYVEDDEHTVYNIEMQTTNTKDLGKRTRYYQSRIDSDLLKKGENYKTLGKSIIIFICTFDPFQKELYQYTFTNRCHEDSSIELDDCTTKIFLNTTGKHGTIHQDIKTMLKYINQSTMDVATGNEFVEEVHGVVETIKSNNRWEMVYVTLEDKVNEGKALGIEEGKVIGREEGAEKFAALTRILIKANRIDDLAKASSDKEFRKQLFEKFNL